MMKLRKVGIVALILPFVLALSSCLRLHQEINVSSRDKIEVKTDFGVLKERAESGGIKDPSEVCQRGESSLGLRGDLKGEGYQDDKYIGCRFSGTVELSDITYVSFETSSKQWTFQMSGSEMRMQEISASMITDFEVRVSFPGKVLTATGNAEISGNTVTWKNPADLADPEGLTATASNDPDLTWLWVVLGVVVVGGGVVAITLVQRRKARKGSHPGPGQPATFQQPGPVQQPGQPDQPGHPGQPGLQGQQNQNP